MADGHHHRGRSAAVVALLLIGALLTPVALLAHWARDTITSTDGYVAAVDDLAADPAVRSALVDHLTTVTLEQIDADALVSSALAALGGSGDGDSRVDALGVPLRFAMESLVRDIITRVVDSDAFRTVWIQANRSAHTTVVALLTHDGGGKLSLSADGQVTLNLGPVVDLARAELVARGVTLAASIPQVDASVPLFSSQELVKARAYYAVLDAVAGWLPWAVALLLLAAVALARSRAVVLAWEAGIIVVLTALASLAVVVVRASYIGSLTGSRLRTELTVSVANILGDSVLGALRVGYTVGVVLVVGAVGAWLVSRRRKRATVTTAGPEPRPALG
ncbi:hypothetical protein SAMN05216410_1193 [Sanguibacter gelidistatuariae]|uniref:Integral membrane protein n=1 Tax=Sanguibacter gelidistatuariae TaxID=1814289 RepID=A0A1G6HS78_9MICO|nr:hypothetical protein [Sanguibacter gelidistatuariae]SDB96998.1 hypothetical protein SAMN05216410_1193 [Sanguibacter gelidistatuariae]